MRIVAIGDIVGSPGLNFYCEHIASVKNRYAADFVIVNGENSAYSGCGINAKTAHGILSAGADVITTGNHAFRSRDYLEVFENEKSLIRPLNFDRSVAGRGVAKFEVGHRTVAVINLIGLSFMETQNSYYGAFDEVYPTLGTNFVIVDFHAEATAEKIAFARYVDGRASVVFGTHTHVQTADETIFSGGTGYITDIGMTGPIESVLGVSIQNSIDRQRLRVPVVFTVADGDCAMCGAFFELDDKSGRCVGIERFRVE